MIFVHHFSKYAGCLHGMDAPDPQIRGELISFEHGDAGMAGCTPRTSEPDMYDVFLARDSMLIALYAIARPSALLSVCLSARLSVCLSVRHTGGSVENG